MNIRCLPVLVVTMAAVLAAALLAAAPLPEKPNDVTVYITNDNCPDYTWGLSEAETRQAFADIVKAHLDEMTRTDKEPDDSRDRYNMTVTQEALCFVEKYPDRKDELIRRIKEGRVFVSPYLCNTLWGFQSLEGTLRAFYPARRLERDWGIPKIEWAEHMEEPSLPSGTATILPGCGIRWLLVPFYNYDSTFGGLKNLPIFHYHGAVVDNLWVIMDPWASNKWSYTQGAAVLKNPPAEIRDWLAARGTLKLGNTYAPMNFLASGTHGDINPASGKQAREFAEAIIKYNTGPQPRPHLVNATLPMFCREIDGFLARAHVAVQPPVSGDFGHSWDCWPVSLAKYAAAMREGERQFLAAEALLVLAGRDKPDLYKATQADRRQAEWCWAMLADHAWNGTDDKNKKVNADLRKKWGTELAETASAVGRLASAKAVPAQDIAIFNATSIPRRVLVVMAKPAALGVFSGGGGIPMFQTVIEEGLPMMYLVPPEIPGFGLGHLKWTKGDAGFRNESTKAEPAELESPFYKLAVDPKTGGVASLVYKPTGAELVAGKAGRTLCQTVFFDGKEQLLENVMTEVVALGPVLARLKITGTVAGMNVTNFVTVYAELDRVDFDVRVSGPAPEKESRLCQFFPIVRDGAVLRAETPAAVIRPQPQPKGDLLPGADAKRLCVQGFIDASTSAGGVTVAPLDAFLLRLDLGDPAFECLGNDQNYKEVTRNQNGEKEFRFRYSVRGHKGGYNQAEAVAWSRDVATPLVAVMGAAVKGEAAPPPVEIDPARAIATCLKPPDDASPGCVVRMWETAGKEEPLSIKVRGYTKAVEIDLLERDLKELPIKDGAVSLPIRPYGLAAIRLAP
jgi:hypothetical protein